MAAHDRSPNTVKNDDIDPVEEMIRKTGCIDLHYKVQECMFDTKDWRKCQEEVTNFKKCMAEYAQSQAAAARSNKSEPKS